MTIPFADTVKSEKLKNNMGQTKLQALQTRPVLTSFLYDLSDFLPHGPAHKKLQITGPVNISESLQLHVGLGY